MKTHLKGSTTATLAKTSR